MASLNKVMLIGNLGKDPEIRYTGTGSAVANFSIATSERFKNKSGEWEEKTEWHNVVLWGKQAEIAKEYLSKGKTVFIEGRLQTRKWQDKDGKDRYTTEVVGDRMQMLTPKGDGAPRAERQPAAASAPAGPAEQYGQSFAGADDDIPF